MKQQQNQSKKIRKGDRVLAIAGNNRGSSGTVLSIQGEKVIVQGLNVRKKHVKKSQENPQGRIIEIEGPIHASNLANCDEENKPVKLKMRTNDQGDREFIYIKDDQEVVYRSIKKPK